MFQVSIRLSYRTFDRSLLWTLQLFCSLETFFSISGRLIFVWLWIHINIFDFVTICLSWLFLLLSDISFSVTINWISLLYFDSQVVHHTFYYITDTFYFLMLFTLYYITLYYITAIILHLSEVTFSDLKFLRYCQGLF